MDEAFWSARWSAGKIGFHEGRPNAWLVELASRLDGKERVLVPLCGKAEDLAFLAARGHQVVGVELIEDAVRAFFAEHGLTPTVTPRGPLVEYTSGRITIYAGDVFALTRELAGPIDAVYDRAALIALPEALRQQYVDHVLRLSRTWVYALTITLEYDQRLMAGPPFSVPHTEVLRLYDGYTVEELGAQPATTSRDDAPPMVERCLLITG